MAIGNKDNITMRTTGSFLQKLVFLQKDGDNRESTANESYT